MGLKTQTILIRPTVLEGGPEKLLIDLGYERQRRIGDVPFQRAGAGSIWIGAAGDCLILYTPLAGSFFGEGEDENSEFTHFRDALFRRFLDADIAALSLHSVVGHWGFAVFRRGALIRCQHGYDGMVLADEGPRLAVEESYLSRYDRRNVDGEIRYRDPNHPEDDDMTDPDLGEDLVIEVCKSYTGTSLDELNAAGTSFWLNDDEEELRRRIALGRAQRKANSRPWWKFWG